MMMSLLSSLFLGLVATNAQDCPPPNCPPLEECGPDMMMCMDPPPPPPMCPPMTCPGDCPPVDPCPTGHCIPMETQSTYMADMSNSIETAIAIAFFGTIAIAKANFQLLLLLLILLIPKLLPMTSFF